MATPHSPNLQKWSLTTRCSFSSDPEHSSLSKGGYGQRIESPIRHISMPVQSRTYYAMYVKIYLDWRGKKLHHDISFKVIEIHKS